MGADQTRVCKDNHENPTLKNVRSIDDCSPRGLSLQRQARAANVCQLKLIEKEDQDFAYDNGNGGLERVKVGKRMVAWLSLKDPDIHNGRSASENTDQNAMMADYRTKTGLVGGQLVKGHLLNENLGGKADNSNLYPITDGANRDHLGYVENYVKYLVSDGRFVWYKVEAEPCGEPLNTFFCRHSLFKCDYKTIDGMQPVVDKSITILSDASVGPNARRSARGSVRDENRNKWLKIGTNKIERGWYPRGINGQIRNY